MANECSVMAQDKIDHDDFITALTEKFPEVAAEIDPDIEGGLLHLEMAEFCRFTQAAIDRGDRELVIRCFQFADRVFANADDAVVNAVYVSYLENLELEGEDRRYAKDLLTSALRAGWIEINEYMEHFGNDASIPKRSKKKPKKQSRDARQGRRRTRG